MENLYEPDSYTSDLLGFVGRNKFTIFVVFVVGVALTLTFLSITPRVYESEAKLLVRLGRESVTNDPAVTNGNTVTVVDSRETEVNAISELLKSRLLLEKVVDNVTPEVVLGKKPDSKSMGDYFVSLNEVNLNPFRVYSLRDKAITHLGKNLDIRASKKSNLITVTLEAADPVQAREMLNDLVTMSREEHLKANRTPGSHEFFESQTELLQASLKKKEEELLKLKDSSGVSSLEQQRTILLERIGQLETDLVKTQADLSAADAEVLARRETLNRTPELAVLERKTGQPNTPESDMRTKLFDVEMKEKEFAAKYNDDNPLLQQVRMQLTEARKSLALEKQNTEETRGVSKTREAMEAQLQEREAQAVNYKARAAALTATLKESRAKVPDLNSHELKVTQLRREIELLAESYKRYSTNLELSRINDQSQEAKISSIAVMEPPTTSDTPSNPKPTLVLGLGGMLSLLASLGVAMLFDRRRLPNPPATSAPMEEVEIAAPAPRSRRAESSPPNAPR